MSWRCSNCETINDDDKKFCEVCLEPKTTPRKKASPSSDHSKKEATDLKKSKTPPPFSKTTDKSATSRSSSTAFTSTTSPSKTSTTSHKGSCLFVLITIILIAITLYKYNQDVPLLRSDSIKNSTNLADPSNLTNKALRDDSIRKANFAAKLDTLKQIIKSGKTKAFDQYIDMNQAQFINYTDENGATLLHYAAKNAPVIMLQHMVKSFSASIRDNNGKLPEDYAVRKKNKTFLNHYRARDSLIFVAIEQNNFNLLNELIDYGVDVNIKNTDGVPLIHFAVRNNTKMLLFLREKGASIEATDANQENALFVAARKDQQEAAKKLLQLGLSGEQTNSSGQTPMNVVTNNTSKYIFEFTYKDSLFVEAIQNRDIISAKHFLNLGAEVDFVDPKTNKTALHYAIQNDDIKAINFLKSNHADFFKKVGNQTPLELALYSKSKKAFTYLLNNDKTLVNDKLYDGSTILHKAATLYDTSWVKIIKSKGGNVYSLNSYGETALVVAIKHKNQIMLQASLIAPSGVVNLQDRDGNYPIHIAARYADSALVHQLIQLGANPKQRNSNDDEPIDIAKSAGNESSERELEEYYITGKMKKTGKRLFNAVKSIFN